mmetsp:Transcript_16285/g.49189  ORF Transcript_16285/g.49189 Transcript_16285/m.49189 type:complete len:300 (+) Transcript_16285:61-960(+)
MRRLGRRCFGFVPLREGQYQVPPAHHIPESVQRPPYVSLPGGHPHPLPESTFAEVKKPGDIERMRRACALARDALRAAMAAAKPGVTAHELDGAASEVVVAGGAYPVGVQFHGFPKATCISPNEVACHGIPDERPLADGDIVNIDVSTYLDGFYGDTSAMILVGDVDEEGRRLSEVCKRCRDEAIAACRPGESYSTIGRIISQIASDNGYSVCDLFHGHFIGRELHMKPNILHYYPNGLELRMRPGQTFTIEPILCQGSKELRFWDDGWTAVTADGGRCAQWEHTVLITESGHEILTPL